MADIRSAGSASSSRSVLEAPPPARSSSPVANAVNAVVAVSGPGGVSEDEQQQAGSPPYFVSCSDACFCAFCILFVVALSLSFALGIAYVQGIAGDVANPPGAANYGSLLSSVMAGSGRQEAAPATRTVNDSVSIR
ncbi:uncharacterized protein LOC119385050 isoform X1 [Rhipicephalus sanguineus]|uniref:uncharacterized protein LOC119385050 isoform X1 n=1 Tax=Rhipicephalus sanguineus TaxID=34632 RepID=UPI0020C5A3E7|nr:uncharacterized protein LOC119385050 isoform X1 [Rhipicephalus sanguineus]